MKITKLIILFFVALLASCTHDETVQQGNAQFSVNRLAGSSIGRKQTDEIPDGSSLILTLSKSNGDSVFNWKKISLLKIGGQFITQPMPLLSGNYFVDDFIIVGPDNTVLFITPKQGSPLSSLVSHTVPMAFHVNANNVANVDVEVISADRGVPAEFGYATFPLAVATPDLSISLFTAADDGSLKFTDGHVIILHNFDTVFQKTASSSINGLNWNAQRMEYKLVIIKDGYAKYTKAFIPDSLNKELAGKPLAIVLKPALTFTWSAYLVTSPPAFSPNIMLDVLAPAKLTIDWGEPVPENIVLTGEHEIDHTYGRPGKYFVSVTGDIKSIKEVSIRDYTATFHSLSLFQLPNLSTVYLSHQIIRSGSVDFSHNPKLVTLVFHNNIGLSTLDISRNPLLIDLDINQNQFSTQTINKIIDDLYGSTVMFGKRSGNFYLGQDFFARTLVGPPSPAQIEKLRSLKRDFDWTISDFN